MKFISLIILHFILCIGVHGLHFLGGTITWHPLNESATGTPVAIVITQTYSWTYSRMPCTSAMIAANQLVPNYGTIPTDMLTCTANCGAGSAGYSAIPVIPYCTDFSAPVGTTVGQRSDIVYLHEGDDFSISFQDSAWRPLATSSGAGWSISATIDLQPRSDKGLYNNAPVATMMSPIYIPVNQPTVINIPVGDADGDPTRCRWSTSTNGVDECGGVCPPSSLPPGTVIYPNCTIIITGQNIGDWFGVTLMVEDFINSTSTSPLSSVPVQFLVQVVGPAACNIPPDIIGIPIEGSCTSVIVGQQFTSELIAINNCGPSVTIVDIATLSFPGMVSSSIAEYNSTEYYKNLTWIPTSAQLGYQVMCAMAFDSQNAQSAQYCFTFYVSEDGVCSCPGYPCITTTSTTTTTATTTTSTSSTSSSSSTSTTSTTSTSSTSTTSTSSTSTTSTSTTSTTATTTTTTTRKADSIDWPLIGSLIGLFFLAALASCIYLCCRYCCPLGIGKSSYEEGIIELYHIEQCVNRHCSSIDDENDFIDISTDSKTNLVENHNLCKTMSGVSVSMVKIDKTTRNEGNPGIKPPVHSITEEETNQTLRRYKSVESKTDIQVTRIRSKRPVIRYQSTINDHCPSLIANTIYLNNLNEIKSPLNHKKLFPPPNSIQNQRKDFEHNEIFLLKPITEQISNETI